MDVDKIINVPFVLITFCQLCGIKLSTKTVKQLLEHRQGMIFIGLNIEGFVAKVKYPAQLDYLYAQSYETAAATVSTRFLIDRHFTTNNCSVWISAAKWRI